MRRTGLTDEGSIVLRMRPVFSARATKAEPDVHPSQGVFEELLDIFAERVVRRIASSQETQTRAASMALADEFLSMKQAAEFSKYKPATLRAWVKKGKLRRYGTKGRMRIRREELALLLAEEGAQCVAAPGADEVAALELMAKPAQHRG